MTGVLNTCSHFQLMLQELMCSTREHPTGGTVHCCTPPVAELVVPIKSLHGNAIHFYKYFAMIEVVKKNQHKMNLPP